MEKYNMKWLLSRYESGEVLKFLYYWGHSNNEQEKIGRFSFSQWFESSFVIEDQEYKSAEHWMMAQKALLFNDKITFQKIIDCKKPAEAKALGRQILRYDDIIWNEHKFDIVKIGNIHKFNQHKDLAEYLIKTSPRILVEASPVDEIWGIGMAQDNPDIDNIHLWTGQNLLGFALMEVRDFLKDFGLFAPLQNETQPPWNVFPNVDPVDMFWRMGKGDAYLSNFVQYFNSLSLKEKTIYKLNHPPPINWKQFYL